MIKKALVCILFLVWLCILGMAFAPESNGAMIRQMFDGEPASYQVQNLSGNAPTFSEGRANIVDGANSSNLLTFSPLFNHQGLLVESRFQFISSGIGTNDIVYSLVNANTYGMGQIAAGPHVYQREDTISLRINGNANVVELYFDGSLISSFSPPFQLANSGYYHSMFSFIVPKENETSVEILLYNDRTTFRGRIFSFSLPPLENFNARPVFSASSGNFAGTRSIDAFVSFVIPEPSSVFMVFSCCFFGARRGNC
jgi:hypothetical protein